jgi:hypothetical protein
VKYRTPSRFWRRLSREYWRTLWLTKRIVADYRRDPLLRGKLLQTIATMEAAGRPLGRPFQEAMNELIVRWGMKDPNPFPVMRFWSWLP